MSNDERNCVPKLAASSDGGRDTNGVVEGETERFVSLLTALAAVEEVRLDVLEDGEEHAASLVGRHAAIGASDALGERSWVGRQMSATRTGRWTGH